MCSYFDEIVTPSAVNTMRSLGGTWDTFNTGMKQMLNFQFMLLDALNNLAGKYDELKQDVTSLSNQLLNIDTAVEAYFDRHPVRATTRDGVPIDDAIAEIQEQLSSLTDTLGDPQEIQKTLNALSEDCVTKEAFMNARRELETTTDTVNAVTKTIDSLTKDLKELKQGNDGKIDMLKGIIREEVENSSSLTIVQFEEELAQYVKETDFAEALNILKEIPADKRAMIPDIIRSVFSDPEMSVEEKLRKAYSMLVSERQRVNRESDEIDEQFRQLKAMCGGTGAGDEQAEFEERHVRDIGTDSGICEAEESRTADIQVKGKRLRVGTYFDGPANCLVEREKPLDEIMLSLSNQQGTARGSNMNEREIATNVLVHCQGIIERQMELVLGAMGIKIDRNDIVTLVGQLKVVEEIQREVESVKAKLQIKVDRSLMLDELKRYLTREEFFFKCREAGLNITDGTQVQTLPKVTRAGSSSARRKKEKSKVVPLMPARSPAMLGVNDKYLRGRDNKMYIRDLPKKSYYERSKMTMEIDGVEAIMDFQPFVPADEASGSPQRERIRVETYDL